MKTVIKSLNSQSGFGLVTLMVAMVIMTSFILMTAQATVGALKAVQFARIKTEVEDLRNYIRVSVDCSQTKLGLPANATPLNFVTNPLSPTPTPTPAIPIALKGKNGNPVIMAETGGVMTRVGDYLLRAFYDGHDEVYLVEWKRDQPNWDKLFKTTGFACPISTATNGSH